MDEVDPLLPKKVAFKLIGCGNTKGYELLGAGKIRAVKMGTRTLIPQSEVNRYQKGLPAATFGRGAKSAAD
jgi:excisionase family DNA binding protein